jgi:hypothetical protein
MPRLRLLTVAISGGLLLTVVVMVGQRAVFSAEQATSRLSGDNPFADPKPAAVAESSHADRINVNVRGGATINTQRHRRLPNIVGLHVDPRDTAIKRALREPTTVEFAEKPLQEVLDYLAEEHKIKIRIGLDVIEKAGVRRDTPVSIKASDLPLRAALEQILFPLNLRWVIEDHLLSVCSEEEANNRPYTVIYNVADLVTCVDDKGQLWEDYDTLSDMITAIAAPMTWSTVGGQGAIAGGTFTGSKVLVISQTQEEHEQIVELLRSLRRTIRMNGESRQTPRRNPPPPRPKGATPESRSDGMGARGMGSGMF